MKPIVIIEAVKHLLIEGNPDHNNKIMEAYWAGYRNRTVKDKEMRHPNRPTIYLTPVRYRTPWYRWNWWIPARDSLVRICHRVRYLVCVEGGALVFDIYSQVSLYLLLRNKF